MAEIQRVYILFVTKTMPTQGFIITIFIKHTLITQGKYDNTLIVNMP